MRFLNLFVEQVPDENNTELYETESNFVEEAPVAVELDDVNVNTLIDDIYAQNDLIDKTKSVFKIEELINSLPKEMVTETKRTSVLAALGVFGLTVTDIGIDGENRVNVLNGVLTKITTENGNSISEKETEIEELKRQIASLEKEIADIKAETTSSQNMINAETERIINLIKFIEGGTV